MVNSGGTGTAIVTRSVKWRLCTHAVYTNGAGNLIDADACEVEGYGGGQPSRAFVHDGTSGDLRVASSYMWNMGQTGQGIHTIAATTGVNLDVSRCRFGAQTGNGQSVYHFDTLGSAPTANTLSRVSGCQFGSGLSGAAIRTPYQGTCLVQENTFSLGLNMVNVSGSVRLEDNVFNSTGAAANFAIVAFTTVSTPIVVKPEAVVDGNTFKGRCQYAIYANTDLDLSIGGDNKFLVGDSTVPTTSHVRVDSGAASGSRVDVRGAKFGGQASSFGFQTAQGVNTVEGCRFFGTFSACVASQGGTPARLSVLRNDVSPASGSAVTLTTAPTSYEAKGNFGSTALLDTPGDVLAFNTQTASYTLTVADGAKVVEGNSASALVVTVPLNSSAPIPVGWSTIVYQMGAGAVSIAAASGVTIRSRGGLLSLAGQYATATLWKRATDEWVLTGDLV
jgi:hypothetical protein